MVKTANGNTVKVFVVQIARGAGGSVKPKAAAVADDDGDEPPF